MKNYGEFIKHHRLASGFKTQRKFAEVTGVSAATISRIEDNKHRPAPETIQAFANHLKSTSLVELMVVCGYWDEENLNGEKTDTKENSDSFANEREFVEKIDLSDQELLRQFKLVVDGRELTPDEAKSVIAFVRVQRQMKEGE